MKKVFSYGVSSVQGDWPVQEDGYFVHPTRGFYSIADGFGGSGAGDLAAKIPLTELREKSTVADLAFANGAVSVSPMAEWQQNFFAEVNGKILKWNEPRSVNKKGGCSFVLAHISADRILNVAQCGACSASIVRSGKIYPVLIPQAAPREGSAYSLPLSALGMAENPTVEHRETPLRAGDFLLLTSSGLNIEDDRFLPEFLSHLALRGAAGADLGPLANAMAQSFGGGAGPTLNRSLFVLEIS